MLALTARLTALLALALALGLALPLSAQPGNPSPRDFRIVRSDPTLDRIVPTRASAHRRSIRADGRPRLGSRWR
jgi:hypothetical protein